MYGRTAPQARARPLAASSSMEKLERWRDQIRAAAQKYQLPEGLLLAVMAVESNYDHRALSEKGAMGLMQLMPGTAKDMFVDDAWDPGAEHRGRRALPEDPREPVRRRSGPGARSLQRRARRGAPRRGSGAQHPGDPRVRSQGRGALEGVRSGAVTLGAARGRRRRRGSGRGVPVPPEPGIGAARARRGRRRARVARTGARAAVQGREGPRAPRPGVLQAVPLRGRGEGLAAARGRQSRRALRAREPRARVASRRSATSTP